MTRSDNHDTMVRHVSNRTYEVGLMVRDEPGHNWEYWHWREVKARSLADARVKAAPHLRELYREAAARFRAASERMAARAAELERMAEETGDAE